MSLRFRKSKSLGKGVRLNLFKKSAGLSFGSKGARIGVGKRGLYTSAGIPGTGLYGISSVGSGGKRRTQQKEETEPMTGEDYGAVASGCLGVIVVGVVLYLLFTNTLAGILVGAAALILYRVYLNTPKQKVKRLIESAVSLVENGDAAKGIELLKKAREIQPDSEQATYLLGAALNNEGKHEEALSHLTEILNRYPDNDYLKLLVANAYYRTGKYDDAIPLLQSIPEDNENYLKVINILAACFYEKEQYNVAIEILQRAPLRKRKLDDDLKEIHYNLAAAYEKIGDKKSAQRHYKRVYSNDVNFLDVKEKVENKE